MRFELTSRRFASAKRIVFSTFFLAAALSSCTSDPKANESPATVSSVATPSGQLVSASTAAAPVETSSTVAFSDVFVPAPKGEYVVVQGTVPKVRVFSSATTDEVASTLENPLPSGAPLTLLVDGQTQKRYKVLLPIRPNGSTGWVEPADVGIKRKHSYRIEVELSKFRIKVFNGNELLMEEKIGVGTESTPTPDGRYYIKELLRPPKPDGIYGPFAYGLSGFSPVLQSFNGGDGTLGIHGTNQPQLLGTNVSHGCIRMSNEAITKLTEFLPLGTPVFVKA